MVRITRTPAIPKALQQKGAPLTLKHCSSVKRRRKRYVTGLSKLSFNSGIYGCAEVKSSLKTMQHEKCCFCEAKITHISYGDVEHFRPKGGWKQDEKDNLSVPGYYWMAYSWENLLLCCQICNQRHKKNHFPLINASKRALSEKDDLSAESPLFIDPTCEDPEVLIGFRGDTPYAINGNARAATSIGALGLDRTTLRERRLAVLEPLKCVYDITVGKYSATQDQIDDAAALLQKFCRADAEFSSAVRASIANGFKYV